MEILVGRWRKGQVYERQEVRNLWLEEQGRDPYSAASHHQSPLWLHSTNCQGVLLCFTYHWENQSCVHRQSISISISGQKWTRAHGNTILRKKKRGPQNKQKWNELWNDWIVGKIHCMRVMLWIPSWQPLQGSGLLSSYINQGMFRHFLECYRNDKNWWHWVGQVCHKTLFIGACSVQGPGEEIFEAKMQIIINVSNW